MGKLEAAVAARIDPTTVIVARTAILRSLSPADPGQRALVMRISTRWSASITRR